LAADGWAANTEGLAPASRFVRENAQSIDIFLGVVLPVLVLGTLQWRSPRTAVGWQRVQAFEADRQAAASCATAVKASRLPAMVVAWALAACGALMAALSAMDAEARTPLGLFAGALLLIAASVGLLSRRKSAGEPRL
jgi:branched-subunit amino acid ABC-type transport system permease component